MHCPSCGVEVGDNDQFCRHCGGRLRATGSVPPSPRRSTQDDATLYTRGRSRWGVVVAGVAYVALAVGSGVAVYAVLNRGPKTGTITLGTPRLLVMSPAPDIQQQAPDSGPAPSKRPRRTGSHKTKTRPRPKPRPAHKTAPAPTRPGQPEKTPPVVPKQPPPAAPTKPEPKSSPTPRATPDKSREDADDAIDRFRANLNAESVRMVVRHHLPQVRACYDRALKQKPDLAGIVEIRFTISVQGTVSGSSVHRNTSGHDGLGKCLAVTIKRWRFPKPVGGSMEFVYPFVFSSSS